jgi:ubiquinone/menaquinone biosynthesis C-methylase UbiE
MSEDPQRHARSFGGVADAYDRGRPSYPDAAVAWLVGDHPVTVLELGAGTGKLTQRLVAAGHDVHATEPDEAMLEILRRRLPDVRTSATGAEEIPVADQSVDVVVAAQCLHWFDADKALSEVARVLRPGGHLAAVWNERDERIPWVRKLGRVIGTQDHLVDPMGAVAASAEFHDVDDAAFKHWQVVDRRSIQDLVLSRSNIAVLGEAERARVIAELLALYDDYGRGMDGMQLPYQARCFRSRVTERAAPQHVLEPTVPIALAGDDPFVDSADTLPRVASGLEDTGTLLIDFR